MDIVNQAEQLFDQLRSWRRHLHKHPELSFQEKETSAFILEELAKIDNIQIEKNVKC